jgi:hypothetical protein
MSNFEDRNKGLPGQVEAEFEVDRDVVVVDGESATRERRNPFAVLPLLLGSLFLMANIFTGKNVNSSISLLLLVASVVTCLVLILYGFASRRLGGEASRDGSGLYLRSVGVALVFGLLAPLFTLWALQVYKTALERGNQPAVVPPCIEVYEKAAAIAKDNPRFRMPAKDREEVRCTVNAVLGR